jgi:hypothetical protein
MTYWFNPTRRTFTPYLLEHAWYGFGTQDGFSIGLQTGEQIITIARFR